MNTPTVQGRLAAPAAARCSRPCSTTLAGGHSRGRRCSTGSCQRLPDRWTARRPCRCVTRDRRPKSAEGRDPGGDPPRQSSRARQYRRNQIRWASSALRDRAALPRSANVRSPLKFFRWLGNCRDQPQFINSLNLASFSAALVSGTKRLGSRRPEDGGLRNVVRALLLLGQLHLGISCDLEA